MSSCFLLVVRFVSGHTDQRRKVFFGPTDFCRSMTEDRRLIYGLLKIFSDADNHDIFYRYRNLFS